MTAEAKFTTHMHKTSPKPARYLAQFQEREFDNGFSGGRGGVKINLEEVSTSAKNMGVAFRNLEINDLGMLGLNFTSHRNIFALFHLLIHMGLVVELSIVLLSVRKIFIGYTTT
jgi:hypothetical protein